MRLSVAMGGGGTADLAGTCAASWVGTVASCWAEVRSFAPCLAHIDIKTSELPIFVEFRAEYARLRAQRDECAAFYDGLDAAASEYFDFDGSFRAKFHHTDFPLAKHALPRGCLLLQRALE
jgi:hypothetical protein